MNYITSLRSISFFNDNGRYALTMNAINVWTYNIRKFLFGAGFSGSIWGEMLSPHNMIIQTLAECGLIFSIIVFGGLCIYIVKNFQTRYFISIIYVLIYGMFVTEFYVNSFTTVLFILVNMFRYVYKDNKSNFT